MGRNTEFSGGKMAFNGRMGLAGLVFLAATALAAPAAVAQVTAFRQAVAETAATDETIAAFYRARGFEGIWTGSDQLAIDRRNALLGAFAGAKDHGLPADRFDPEALIADLRGATTPAQQGAMEVRLTELFLEYARDINTGILIPARVDPGIKRDVPYHDPETILADFVTAPPATFLRSLAPTSAEYTRLLREKLMLESLMVTGGWGLTVPGGKLEPGDSGDRVVALRNRLILMGYLPRTTTRTYDTAMTAAVYRFQEAHGLTADGVAGEGTLAQINISIETRLESIVVAMERERWLNIPRGDRHIWVNLTDFTANIVDHDRVTFTTRSVIGANDADRRSPEFSDLMEFMVINPSWSVPRSIVVNEYLPSLRGNPGAAGHLQIIDSRGRIVDRGSVDFASYSASSFPFAMRQAPGPGNALGEVKFMFPNPYNIYLHDTPSRSLFSREVRAFSHGCIRLNDPKDFAYALLARQTADPEGVYQAARRTGAEIRVNLEIPVPVHIDYRTAFTMVDGTLQFRRDIYGRDARIWDALAREGVAVGGVQG
jgi:murein L,D-transpeptidase YcbB/YkuD